MSDGTMERAPVVSAASDYAADVGCPEADLRAMAEAGFTCVHWCHHWNTDFLYSAAEVQQIARWLRDFGLQLLDLHGSHGREKGWCSPREYERLAGIELVENRIEMTARLGGDAVVMHIPDEPADAGEAAAYWDRMRRTLDVLEPSARLHGVRIAIENTPGDNFPTMRRLFDAYDPDYLGLCYDSGHGNIAGNGLECLAEAGERLIAIHLHDNDGVADLHKPPFTGTTDWERLAAVLAASGYAKPVNLEVGLRNCGHDDPRRLLRDMFDAATRIARSVARARARGD